jgi:hypothetical protein
VLKVKLLPELACEPPLYVRKYKYPDVPDCIIPPLVVLFVIETTLYVFTPSYCFVIIQFVAAVGLKTKVRLQVLALFIDDCGILKNLLEEKVIYLPACCGWLPEVPCVRLYPFPDLSFHCETEVPEVARVFVSAASSQIWQAAIFKGFKDALLILNGREGIREGGKGELLEKDVTAAAIKGIEGRRLRRNGNVFGDSERYG